VNRREIDRLKSELKELAYILQEAVKTAKSARSIALRIGGELGETIAKQLDHYTIEYLKAFIEDEHQPGSVKDLLTYLEEETDKVVK